MFLRCLTICRLSIAWWLTWWALVWCPDAAGQYLRRVCNSPYCAMCNRIDAHNRAISATLYVTKPHISLSRPSLEVNRFTSKTAQTYSPGKFGPTPPAALPPLLGLLDLRPGDTLVDIGCGDGRILIAGAQASSCRGVGYEIQPSIARLAERQVAAAGLAGQITIIEGDARQVADLAGKVVYSYMWPAVTGPLANRLRTAKRVVSYLHPLPLPAVRHTIHVSGKAQTVWVWSAAGETDATPNRLDIRALDREWSQSRP